MSASRCPNDHEAEQSHAFCTRCGSAINRQGDMQHDATGTELDPDVQQIVNSPLKNVWGSLTTRPIVALVAGFGVIAVTVTGVAVAAKPAATGSPNVVADGKSPQPPSPELPSLGSSGECVVTVLKHLRIHYDGAARNSTVESDAAIARWLADGGAQTPEWLIFGGHNVESSWAVLSGVESPEEQIASEAPSVVRECAEAYNESEADASLGLERIGLQPDGAGAGREGLDQSQDVKPSSEPAPTPTPAQSEDSDQWSDPALWDMDCTQSHDPTRVEVHHVATDDVDGDGVDDTVVAASCTPSTSAWPDSVVLFNGANSDSATLINDSAPQQPSVESLAIDGDLITIDGTLRSPNASNCCPDLRFSDRYVVTSEEWRRLAHKVWPADQEKSVGYGAVTIGMSLDQLLATGEVARSHPAPGCSSYELSYGGEAVYSDSSEKVVAIFFDSEMATSKGIDMGSTKGEVMEAYPGGTDRYGYWTVEVTTGVHYEIGLSSGGVSELILASDDQDCFG